MTTTFDVFYLGTGPSIDQVEGDYLSENAGALVGLTFGGPGDALVNNIQTFSPGSTGYFSGDSTRYDTNNSGTNDTFRIDGGADQVVDGLAVYNATITYTDGSTAVITAVVLQDTAGRLYLVPETSYGADQVALEAQPILSLTLDSVVSLNTSLSASRYAANYAVCFTSGTAIRTPQGDRLIDDLRVGDLVVTLDNGPHPIRWIGHKHLSHAVLQARPDLRPILIPKGVLGVSRHLLVSPQHGMLLGRDHLVRAKHLIGAPKSQIRTAHGRKSVSYIHLMFDSHQIVFAENAPSESFYPGQMAQRMVDRAALTELRTLFPDACAPHADSEVISNSYGETARPFLGKKSIRENLRQLAQAVG